MRVPVGCPVRLSRAGILAALALLPPPAAAGESPSPIPFDSPRWTIVQGSVVEHLGRKALAGSALLGDTVFGDGVIEFDIAVNGERSYPGVLFRIASRGNHERVYLRPHHANTARVPDVVQYVAAFNGIDSWQLYGGDGKTAYAELPTGRWVTVRVEVSGTQARVFLDGAERPSLEIHELQRGNSKGGLGLLGPADGSAYFSDFRFRADDTLRFDAPPAAWPAPGFIADWELSQPLRGDQLDDAKPLGEQKLPPLAWRRVTALPGGLVDISRHYGRLGPGIDAVVARTRLTATAREIRRLRFGYSDAISVFVNGRPLFAGDSSYLSRDPSFPGFIGLFDHLFLPLEEGENDLTIYLYEGFGGWGFQFQDARAEFSAPLVTKLWETPAEIPFAESAAYDPARRVFYVSAYDAVNPDPAAGRQFLARLGLDGRIEALRWVDGLTHPTDLVLAGDTLLAVEPTGIVVIDVPAATIRERVPVAGAVMLNKAARGADGALFVTDSRKGVIWRLADGRAEEWLTGLVRPNALHLRGGMLFVGINGDGTVRSIDLATRASRTLARFGPGILVGIDSDDAGNLLVSQVEGRVFRVAPDGTVTRLLDTSVPGRGACNLAYVPEQGLLVVPTWTGNAVAAYSLGTGADPRPRQRAADGAPGANTSPVRGSTT
ncbi:MAG: hypothetical protein MUF27_10030 [Acidobacteria bacterium]|jgi:hypothetical protein|nr:hypothetical protein [Acidobacteriota bacterium]